MTKASPTYKNTGTPSFPLFNSLLQEGRLASGGRLHPQCPATAPVLPHCEAGCRYPLATSSYVRTRTGLSKVMDKIDKDSDQNEETVKDAEVPGDTCEHDNSRVAATVEEENIIPITLQSPPKSRLKRQLSIDTVDRTERERICKKIYACHSGGIQPASQTQWTPYIDPGRDEVDGERSTAEKRISSQDHNTSETHGRAIPEGNMNERLFEPIHIHTEELTERRSFPGGSRTEMTLQPTQRDTTNTTQQTERRSFPEASRNEMALEHAQRDELRKSPLKNRAPVHIETSTTQMITVSKPQPSPNLFNLNEIGLTSPFINTTPRAHAHDDVFVFPDPVPARKVSPYKHPVDVASEINVQNDNLHSRSSDDRLCPPQRDFYLSENVKRERPTTERRPQYTREESRDTDNKPEAHNFPQYLSPKGFIWPKTVTMTEPPAFSPRVVTAEAKPRFPATATATASSSSTPSSSAIYKDIQTTAYNNNNPTTAYKDKSAFSSYEDDLTRLQNLQREYARAKDIFGCPPKDPSTCALSPRSRQVSELILSRSPLRSISDIERSPNEKDIRETGEDVRSKYERSISDPTCNPRQYRIATQQPSPLSRERGRIPAETNPQELLASTERPMDPWQADVRRRLFMKGDNYMSHDQRRRPLPGQPQPPAGEGSLDIPDEVLQFLHTRNFHPEDLENLKDILRRGTSSPSTSATSGYQRSASSPYESSIDASSRIRMEEFEQEMRRRSMAGRFEQQYGKVPVRERRHGEIDVRLTCDNITENTRHTQEILRDLDHDGKDCKCARIEEEIRRMAMDAYTKIRRADTSVESFYQFQNEVNETNTNVFNSMQILCGIKCLCKYDRTLEEVYTGSVVFRLWCPGVEALGDLWTMYKSGDLQNQLQDAFITAELLEKFDCSEIRVKVTLSLDQYLACKQELSVLVRPDTSFPSPIKSPIIHARSRSEPASVTKQANQLLLPKTNLSPFRERFCSDTSVELSPRKAFAEINARKQSNISPLPSKKHVPDNVFSPDDPSLSPLTSPRRTSFGILPSQLEQENVDSAGASVTSPRQHGFPDYPWSDNREHRVTDL